MSAELPPTVRASVVLRLAVQGIAGHRVRSTLTLVLVALAVAAVVATTGRTEVTRDRLLLRLEDPSARLVRIMDRDGRANLAPDSVARLAAVRSVEWVVGLSAAGPLARNLALGSPRTGFAGEPVGTRQYWGNLAGAMATALTGRDPRPGEAIASPEALRGLGLADGIGTIEDEALGPVAVVGSIRFAAAIRNLDSYALIRGLPDVGRVTEILVLVRTSAQVEPLLGRIPGLLAAPPASYGVERAAELLAVRRDLSAEVGELDRAVLLGSLLTSSLLVGAVSYGAIEQRRREFGIRRAQGATRSTIAALVLIESALLASGGIAIGGILGTLAVLVQTATLADPLLTIASGALIALAAVAGSLPPASIAALREPLYALRSE